MSLCKLTLYSIWMLNADPGSATSTSWITFGRKSDNCQRLLPPSYFPRIESFPIFVVLNVQIEAQTNLCCLRHRERNRSHLRTVEGLYRLGRLAGLLKVASLLATTYR